MSGQVGGDPPLWLNWSKAELGEEEEYSDEDEDEDNADVMPPALQRRGMFKP